MKGEELDAFVEENKQLLNDLKDVQYKEENKKLLQSRKKELFEDLNKIIHNLNKKKDINEFLEDKKNYLSNNILSEVKERKRKNVVFFNIKIVGVFFLFLYLIGIYQLIGFNEAIQDEIIYSLKLHYLNKTKEYTFYEIYNKKNKHEVPNLSLFFLSSFLSNCLFKCLGFYLLTIFIMIFNGLIILIGLNNFNFHERNDDNIIEDYSTKEISLLFIYLILLNVFLGFVGMLPQKLFLNAYYYYEKYLKLIKNINNDKNIEIIKNDEIINDENNIINENNNNINIDNKNKNENKNGNIINNDNINKNENKNNKKLSISNESSFNIIDINNDDIFEPKTKEINIGKFNGFYFSYIFSFIFSIICKFVINKLFLLDKEKSERFFLYVYLIHFIPIILSLFFFIFFSSVFTKKKDKNNYISVMKFLGYLIYIQGIPEEKKVCCLDCRIGMRKFFYGAMCYSCKICDCCECNICCRCVPISECCKKEEDLSEIKNRKKKICIFYKLNGFCSWICEFISNSYVLYAVIFIFLFELFNIGFKLKFVKNIQNDEIDDGESTKIFIFYLIGIIVSYFLIIFNGYCMSNLMFTDPNKSEGSLLGFGLIFFIFVASLYTIIISSLIYNGKINNSLENYFMAYSISMCEYVKILILNSFSTVDESLELLPYSCIISIYLFIYKMFTSIFDIFDIEPNKLILFQFILGIISGVLSLCILCCSLCFIRNLQAKDIIEANKMLDAKHIEIRKQNSLEIKKEKLNEKKEDLELINHEKKNNIELLTGKKEDELEDMLLIPKNE